MTPEEREKMNELCKSIQQEQDPDKFSRLIEQLNALVESKEDRLRAKRRDY